MEKRQATFGTLVQFGIPRSDFTEKELVPVAGSSDPVNTFLCAFRK